MNKIQFLIYDLLLKFSVLNFKDWATPLLNSAQSVKSLSPNNSEFLLNLYVVSSEVNKHCSFKGVIIKVSFGNVFIVFKFKAPLPIHDVYCLTKFLYTKINLSCSNC